MSIPLLADVMADPAPGTMGLVATLVVVAGAMFGITLFSLRVITGVRQRRLTTPTDEGGLRSVLVADAPFVKTPAEATTLLARQLEAEGVVVEPALESEGEGILPVAWEDEAFVVRASLSDGRLVVRVCDRGAANRPASESRHAPLVRRSARRFLERLDRAARQSPALASIRWHAREHFDRGESDAGAHAPFEE